MPFINTSGTLRFRRITGGLIVNVDTMLTVSCNDIIMLTGTTEGSEIGHRFRWEQISGTPVQWLEDVNQLTVMFQQSVVRDDKIFRLTVDEGTAFSQTHDILVSAIPTDYVLTNSHSSYFGTVSLLSDNPTLISPISPALRPAGSQVLNDSLGMLSIQTPSYVYKSLDTAYTFELFARTPAGFVSERTQPASYVKLQTINEVPSNTTLKLETTQLSISSGVVSTDTSNSISRLYPIPNLNELALSDADIVTKTGSSKKLVAANIIQLSQPALLYLNSPTDVVTNAMRVSSSATVNQVVTRELAELQDVPFDTVFARHSGGGASTSILEIRDILFSSLG